MRAANTFNLSRLHSHSLSWWDAMVFIATQLGWSNCEHTIFEKKFECIYLKFMISGWSKQTNISMHMTILPHFVLGSLRLTLTTAAVAIWNMFHMTMITFQSSNMISLFKHVTLANWRHHSPATVVFYFPSRPAIQLWCLHPLKVAFLLWRDCWQQGPSLTCRRRYC